MKKARFMPGLAAIGFFVLIIPVTGAIVASFSLTVAAAYENVKFARSADQTVVLISSAREAAAKDPRFGQMPNEDIIDDLIRLGRYATRPVNGWGGTIRATIIAPSFMRIEADLSSRACQRVADFFGKQASDVALQNMEAREWNSSWRLFYNVSNNPAAPGLSAIDAACGDSGHSTLALTVRLR